MNLIFSGFLAMGDTFQTTPFCYRLGYSTVQSTVLETCDYIIKQLKSGVMCVSSKEDWEQISFDFLNIWNYPKCLGVLDGKHVTIIAAPNSGSLYFNYKKNFHCTACIG
jgi:hypothetical protein